MHNRLKKASKKYTESGNCVYELMPKIGLSPAKWLRYTQKIENPSNEVLQKIAIGFGFDKNYFQNAE